MARRQHTDRDDDYERDLLVRQRAMEAAGQLRDAEARADEDAQRRDARLDRKALKKRESRSRSKSAFSRAGLRNAR